MIKQKIQKIMCCCGNGVGTSLIMQMTVEEALDKLGVTHIEVIFGSLSEVSADRADLFVVSQEIVESLGELPVIGLEDFIDSDMVAMQLRTLLEIR